MIERSGPGSNEPAGGERYTFISADTHVRTSYAIYRSYVDPVHLDAYDEWCRNVARTGDLESRPLDPDTERNDAQNAGGAVGEVVFPDDQPPFYPETVLMSGPPRAAEYERRLAGVRALNRWMADFCGAFPHRRAGVGSILLNDLDDTVAEVEWIAEHGLRGGIQLPNITPDVDWIPQIADPVYDRLWAACQGLGVVVNMHLETSLPALSAEPTALFQFVTDAPHYVVRQLLLMTVSGVFDRFPGLKVTLTEQPAAVVCGIADYLDPVYAILRETGAYGNFSFPPDMIVSRPPSDYLRTNVWYTASPPLRGDLEMVGANFGHDHLMVANDYPHSEGTDPHTTAILRQMFHDWEPSAVRKVLSETPAELYGFDLDALAPEAALHGPSVAELSEPVTELPDRPNYILRANAHALGSPAA